MAVVRRIQQLKVLADGPLRQCNNQPWEILAVAKPRSYRIPVVSGGICPWSRGFAQLIRRINGFWSPKMRRANPCALYPSNHEPDIAASRFERLTIGPAAYSAVGCSLTNCVNPSVSIYIATLICLKVWCAYLPRTPRWSSRHIYARRVNLPHLDNA